jgi:hypothetical protein
MQSRLVDFRLAMFGAAAVLCVAAAFVAGPAMAAFPGGDGLLAVEPLKGSGIVLVGAHGGGKRRVCATLQSRRPVCSLVRPKWSPDGRSLLVGGFSSVLGSVFYVIYPDGSCLDCQAAPGSNAVFTNDPTVITASWSRPAGAFPGLEVPGPLLGRYGIDGLMRDALVSGVVSDPAWSASGELALVRGSRIWVGIPERLRPFAQGRAPSWSPDGKKIVFARSGWLLVGRIGARSVRRLVRGAAPAWSPDGRWIAFIGAGHRLSVVRAIGGRVRRVGDVTGRTVDWQPLPPKPFRPCAPPPGSTVIASDDTAIVTRASGPYQGYGGLLPSAYMGCLTADGRERLLARYDWQSEDGSTTVSDAVLAGTYAALNVGWFDFHYGGNSHTIDVFDIRTGMAVSDRGGESALCSEASPCESSIDQFALGSDAVSAAHTTIVDTYRRSMIEQIVASDSAGVHALDSVTEPLTAPNQSTLTNLTLTGDTLTWDHDGTPRTAQLQP